jgi:hypothetical protein
VERRNKRPIVEFEKYDRVQVYALKKLYNLRRVPIPARGELMHQLSRVTSEHQADKVLLDWFERKPVSLPEPIIEKPKSIY